MRDVGRGMVRDICLAHVYLEKQCGIQRVLFERRAKVYMVSFISFRLKDAAKPLMLS